MHISIPEIWIIIGFICVLLEFVIPGALIVFFGISAILVGLLIKIVGLPTANGIPFLVFIVLAVGQILLLRNKLKSWFTGKSLTGNDDTLEEFVGKDASVVSRFDGKSKKGTVVFKGANWNAICEASPLTVGDEVVIEKQEGITLTVRKK
jgi:inner membrane protein